jgi:hypothetical protein
MRPVLDALMSMLVGATAGGLMLAAMPWPGLPTVPPARQPDAVAADLRCGLVPALAGPGSSHWQAQARPVTSL